MRGHEIAIAVLCAACGGEVDQQAQMGDAGAPQQADAGEPREERAIPLCAGAHEPGPDDCQELHYGSHGYCNAWVSCEDL